MSEFLSPEWVAALDDAARNGAGLEITGAPLVIEQRVQQVPGRGEVRYHVVLDSSGARVRSGSAPEPTVVVETDFETAVALARGEVNAQAALTAGRWKLHGTVGVLSSSAGLLQSIDDVFSAARATTTFPTSPTST